MKEDKILHIAIVAGEHSGDLLGGSLIEQLKIKYPHASFTGIGGEAMKKAGLISLADINRLSVMGIFEVLKHLKDIFKLENSIMNYWRDNLPDIFIGIDAPDFNLRISKKLHQIGVKTVQYVSPSVWAWKEKRIYKIKKSIDLVLCLLPFETQIYDKHDISAVFVGHPMRDRLQFTDPQDAKLKLGLDINQSYLGLLPGSRKGEIERLLPLFIATFDQLKLDCPELQGLVSVSQNRYKGMIESMIYRLSDSPESLKIIPQNSQELMASCDCLLLASGTITLEACLLEKPMVVAYKVHPLTAMIARRMLKIKYFSLPNLLANKEVVHEWIQEDCTQQHLYEDSYSLLNDIEQRQQQITELQNIAKQLPFNVSEKAAIAIQQLISS